MGFPLKIPPAKQQGPGSQRQPRPSLAYGDQSARGEKGQRSFAEQMCICTAMCFPRRVDVSRMQLSEPRFEPWVRIGLRDEVPSWLWEDSWGLRPECIFLPTPASSRRGRHLEWISSSGDHQQSSRPQGARGSPEPLWPMENRDLGENKASVALLSKGALGLWFIPRGVSTFPECSSPHGVWSGA